MAKQIDIKIKASFFYLLGNLFDKAIAFITVPIFTRLLSVEEYGILNTYTSWVSVFAIVVGLSLGQTLRSAYYDKKDRLDSYLSSIYSLSIIDLIVTVIIVMVLSNYFDFQITRYMLLLCVIQSFMQFVRDTFAMKLMMEMDYIKRTLVLALPNIAVAILSVFLIMNMDSERYMGRIYAYVIIYFLIGITCLINQYRRGRTIINFSDWKYGLSLSIPLIIHSFSCVLLSSSDRIMITKFVGATETGIYSLVYNMSLMITVITSSLENVWIPWFSKKMTISDKHSINKAVGPYIMCSSVLVSSIMFVSPELIRFLAPMEYWDGRFLIPPLMISVFVTFLYTLSTNLEYYKKSTKTIAKNTAIAALSNLILNLIFIPRFGSVAAAYTTLASYIISFFMHYRDGKKLDPDLFPAKKYIIPLVIIIFSWVMYYLILQLWVLRWVFALLCMVFILLYLQKKRILITRKVYL